MHNIYCGHIPELGNEKKNRHLVNIRVFIWFIKRFRIELDGLIVVVMGNICFTI